jgi:threonine dehydrogenase-like Zn-dependent dehydrogenase
MSVKRSQVAIVGPQQAQLLETDFDDAPAAADELVGRTVVSLISAGTEISGYYVASKTYPRFPGYAAVFEVEQAGPEAGDVRPGELVLCMGPHASRQRCRRADASPLPAGLAPEKAACARMAAVSMTTLATTAARPPDLVMVTGLGPVGNLAAQVFQACGYRVLGVEPIAQRRETAQACGIGYVAERAPRKDEPDFAKVALAVECSGHEKAVLDACACVRKGGEVVLVGVPWERKTDLYAFDLLHRVFHKYVVLRSGWEWELPTQPADFRPHSILGNIRAAMDWLAQGRLRVDGLLELRRPSEAQACYQDLLHRRTSRLITLFDWCADTA